MFGVIVCQVCKAIDGVVRMQNTISINSLIDYKDTNWSVVLSNAFKEPVKLLKFLHLDTDQYLDQLQAESKFKMLVPLSYAEKMIKGDWNDPL